MNATPFLVEIGRALAAASLDAVLIGNAAAALHGASVTTVDFDFLFRRTPRNLRKLKGFARALGATVLRPYYPISDLFRVMRDDGLHVNFVPTMRALQTVDLSGVPTSGTPRRRRMPPAKRPPPRRRARLAALKRESERALDEQIRRLIALPPAKRTNFLRKRRPGEPGSYL